MSVNSIISGGVRLIRTQPRTVAIWTGLNLIVITLGMIALRPFMTSMMAFQQQVAANRAMGITTPPAFPTGTFGSIFLLDLIYAILGVIAFVAVVRATAWPSRDRFAYLRLGKDEFRLFGLVVLFFIAAFIAEIVAIIMVSLVAGLASLALGKAVAFAIARILGIILLCGAIYVEVRMSLAGALTVLRGHIVIKDAWRATRGRFWMLFAVYLLLSLGFLVVGIVILAVISPSLLAAYSHFDPQAMNAAAQQQYARMSDLSFGFIVQMLVGAVLGVVMWVAAFGAIATAAVELDQTATPAPVE